MALLPPPPPSQPDAPTAGQLPDPSIPPPPPGPAASFPAAPPRPTPAVEVLRPGQLTSGWRTASTVGWLGVIVGLFAVSDTADFIGKPTWWQLHDLFFVPFIVPLLAGAVAYVNWRWTLWVSLLGVASIGASALVTRADAPGAAVVEAAIAGAALLVTIASLAGRVRPDSRSSAG